VKTLVRFTNELLRESVIGLDRVLKDRLVSDVARQIDDAFLTGDGADNSVTGIINQPGVQTASFDPNEPDAFLDALALASAAEVTPNRWFMSGADFFTVREVKDNSGNNILESDITTGTTYRLFGVPVNITNKLPFDKATLANIAEIAVARDIIPTV